MPDDTVKTTSDTQPKAARKRFSKAERRAQILNGAVAFFAEHGFDASTHQLAEQLGITQPLIYRYFPRKEDLFEAVYEEVFVGRWQNGWEAVLGDRTLLLRARLQRFYEQYGKVIQSAEWMRLYLYAGLKDLNLNRRYNAMVEKTVIIRICSEVRHTYDLPTPDSVPITPAELEAVWTLHGGIFYYGVRRYVYKVPVAGDFQEVTERAVDVFLGGMSAMVKDVLKDI